MIKDIEQKIVERAIEAINLAKRMQEATSEGFVVTVSVTKKLNRAAVEIHPMRRPFPIGKFQALQHSIGGKFQKTLTACKFTKLTQVRYPNPVRLTVNVYFEECLNPASRDKVEVQRGVRGRVLTPEYCDGAEFAIMRGLDVEEKGE